MQLSIRLQVAAIALIFILGSALASADVVPVVSAKSAVTALTRIELVDIFLGKRARFPDGSVAVPIDQAEGSAARDQFYSSYADMSGAQLLAYWSKIIFTGRGEPPKTVANGKQAKQLVTTNPDAIAYVDRSLVDSSVRVVQVH